MTITCGFYNSLAGDRKYNATQIAMLFDGIINDGVFASIGNSLIVEAGSGMTVNVGIGRAWFNQTWLDNDAILPLTLEASEVVLSRIDSVVVEINAGTGSRENTIKIVKGVAASSPIAPVMANTGTLHQHALCTILVGPNVTSITNLNITNLVGTASCPFVTGLLETITLDGISLILNAKWDVWFAGIEAQFYGLDAAWDTWFDSIKNNQTALEAGWNTDWDTWFGGIQNNQTDLEAGWASEWTVWFNTVKDTLNGDAAGNLLHLIETATILDTVAPIDPKVNTVWLHNVGIAPYSVAKKEV